MPVLSVQAVAGPRAPAVAASKASRPAARTSVRLAAAAPAAPDAEAAAGSSDPLMLRAVKGEAVERSPVWMMRQAGRYQQVYKELCKKHTTFRERSEIADVAVEVSLQPWNSFKPDGVILFSDILTPLTGMNIPFDIVKGKGPVIETPIRDMDAVNAVTKLYPEESCAFVGEALRTLRQEIANESTVLGFVGAPFSLASYIVDGATTTSFEQTKRMAFNNPEILHTLLDKLADNIADYVRYQADSGAQIVQIFDSWAATLCPEDFDEFSGQYIKKIIDSVKATHPDLPIILYISGSAGLLERMAACGPDIVSVDQHVDLLDAIDRVQSVNPDAGFQGNMDPGVLFGSHEFIEKRTIETIQKARSRNVRHIMNLGHGVLPTTPEENVGKFFETCRNFDKLIL